MRAQPVGGQGATGAGRRTSRPLPGAGPWRRRCHRRCLGRGTADGRLPICSPPTAAPVPSRPVNASNTSTAGARQQALAQCPLTCSSPGVGLRGPQVHRPAGGGVPRSGGQQVPPATCPIRCPVHEHVGSHRGRPRTDSERRPGGRPRAAATAGLHPAGCAGVRNGRGVQPSLLGRDTAPMSSAGAAARCLVVQHRQVASSRPRTPSSTASRCASMLASGVRISWARSASMRRRVDSTSPSRSARPLMVAASWSNSAPRPGSVPGPVVCPSAIWPPPRRPRCDGALDPAAEVRGHRQGRSTDGPGRRRGR